MLVLFTPFLTTASMGLADNAPKVEAGSGTPGSYTTTPRSAAGLSDEYSKEEVGKELQFHRFGNEMAGSQALKAAQLTRLVRLGRQVLPALTKEAVGGSEDWLQAGGFGGSDHAGGSYDVQALETMTSVQFA